MRPYLLAFLLLFFVPACSLWAAAAPALPIIAAVLADASQTLEIIDATVREWQRRTNPPAELMARYDRARRGAYAALSSATRTVRGVEDLDQEQYDAAFYEFRKAYAELERFMAESGAANGGALKASGGPPEPLPKPLALTTKIEN